MKEQTHPDYHPVIFKDGDDEIKTRSTITSDKTREEDGTTYHVVSLEVSAFSHPFYTGQKRLVDSEGRIDQFNRRYSFGDSSDSDDEADDTEESESSS